MLTTKKQAGFTIVELLIVIIVIAILATLVITAYNGVQQKAANAKTISAAEAWVQIIRSYNAETGLWPTAGSCLGSNYPSGFNGDDSPGQCSHGNTWDTTVNPTFNSQIQPYANNSLPTPDMQTIGSAESWRRGITWSYTVGNAYDLFVVQNHVTTCPKLGGTTYDSFGGFGSGLICRYLIQSAS